MPSTTNPQDYMFSETWSDLLPAFSVDLEAIRWKAIDSVTDLVKRASTKLSYADRYKLYDHILRTGLVDALTDRGDALAKADTVARLLSETRRKLEAARISLCDAATVKASKAKEQRAEVLGYDNLSHEMRSRVGAQVFDALPLRTEQDVIERTRLHMMRILG